jgi:hypothetical protein
MSSMADFSRRVPLAKSIPRLGRKWKRGRAERPPEYDSLGFSHSLLKSKLDAISSAPLDEPYTAEGLERSLSTLGSNFQPRNARTRRDRDILPSERLARVQLERLEGMEFSEY